MKDNFIIKTIKNLLFFTLLIVLTFYFILRNQNLNELFSIIKNVNIYYILLAVISMLLFFIIESINVRFTLKNLGEVISLPKVLKNTLICFFFNGITPAATGGEPMEIYYLSKDKVKSSNAILALLIQSCGFLIVSILFGIISAIINYKVFTHYLIWIFILAVSMSTIVLTIMLICIFSPKLMDKVIDIIIIIIRFITINRIKLSKAKFNKTIETYKDSSTFIKSNVKVFLRNILRNSIQAIFFYLIPYFVYKSLGLSGYSVLKFIGLEAILYSATSSIPLPGAIGISETVYLLLFKNVLVGNYLNSAMILSRGISFYLYVMVGLITLIINSIYLKKVK